MATDLHLSPYHSPPYVPPDNGMSALPWISRGTPAPHLLPPFRRAMCFGGGKFVAVGFGGARRSLDSGSPDFNVARGDAMVSEDGVHWTASESSPVGGTWNAVAYGNGLFVAVGENTHSPIMSSADGINWTGHASPIDRYWTSIAYGDGLWIAMAPTTAPDIWQIRARFQSSQDPWIKGPPRTIYSFDGQSWFTTSGLDNLGDTGTIYDPGAHNFVLINGVYYDTSNPEDREALEAAGFEFSAAQSATRWSSLAYGPSNVPGRRGNFVAVSSTDAMFAILNRADFGDSLRTNNLPWVNGPQMSGSNAPAQGPYATNKVCYNAKTHQFIAVRYGPTLAGSTFRPWFNNGNVPELPTIAHAWTTSAEFPFWQPLGTPEDGRGWTDIAVNPDTGTVVAAQPITAPLARPRGSLINEFVAQEDKFRAYVPTLVRMEKDWPREQAFRVYPVGPDGEEVFDLFSPNPSVPIESITYKVERLGGIAGLMAVSEATPRRGYGVIAYGNNRFVALETEPARALNPDELPGYLSSYFDIPLANTTSYVSLDDGNHWVYNIIDGSTDWTAVTFGANAQVEKSGSLLPDQNLGIRIGWSAAWDIVSPTPFVPPYAHIGLAMRTQWDVTVSNAIEYSVTVDDPSDDRGVFVAVSSHNSPDPIMWSPNGITWNRSFVTGTDRLESQWFDVQWGGVDENGEGGQFVALGNTTQGDQFLGGPFPTIMTSSDGIDWSEPRTFQIDGLVPTPGYQGQRLMLRSLVYGDGRWVAVGALGGVDSTYVIYGTADAVVVTSTDLQTWRAVTDGVPDFTNWRSVTYGNGQYVAVGGIALTRKVVYRLSSGNDVVIDPGSPISSEKVGTVSSDLEDPAFGLVMTSTDGLHWTTRSASHLAHWESVTSGVFDMVKHFYIAINDSYQQPTDTNDLAQGIARLCRLIRNVATNRELSENFPDLTFGIGNIFVKQAVDRILSILENNFNVFLELIAQLNDELATQAQLTLTEAQYGKFQHLMTHLTPFDLHENSLDRISQLLGGTNIFDEVTDGYITRQAMYSLDGITWEAMDTLPGTYTAVAWGADYCLAVADANPYRQSYSTGQVMQSYLHQPWINALGSRNGQPPPPARSWRSITSGRGRFVAVANAEWTFKNKNPTDVRYGLSQKVYRGALDDLVMTCDPFCQPLLPRRTEALSVEVITKVSPTDQFRPVGLARVVIKAAAEWGRGVLVRAAAGWTVGVLAKATAEWARGVAIRVTSDWDVQESVLPEVVLSDNSDFTFLTGVPSGSGLRFVAGFKDLDNPYGKNVESFRISVRCSRATNGAVEQYYPTAPSNQGTFVPVKRSDFFDRAVRIAATQDSSLLFGELDEYTWDTYRYADYPNVDLSHYVENELEVPDLSGGPVPTLYIDVDGLEGIYVYSRGQNLNPDNRITTFNSLQFQRRSGGSWTPEEFAEMTATIRLTGVYGVEIDPVRVYAVQCLTTLVPDWKKPECDPDRFYRPPWSARRRSGTWDTKGRYVWRLALEARAQWDAGPVNAAPDRPDGRIRFTP